MNARTFGSLGRLAPVIGQGTWNLPTRGAAVREAEAALRLGIDLGMTHIDTAEMYGDGRSEEIVGAAVRGIARDRLFIVSKVLPSHASYEGTLRACDASLRRMGLEYLDLYLLHWRGSLPLAETMGALEHLVDVGKIRALGVSNFDVEDLEQARSLAGKHPVVCDQVLHTLEERGIERRLSAYCREHDIAVVGYSPLGSGNFPTKRTARGRVLDEIAQRRRITPQQVALAFLARSPGTFLIPKAVDPEHVRANAAAGDIVLADEEIARIDQAFPKPAHDAPLAVI